MKTAILTFNRANNYGAALQAFALLEKMNQLGFQAELLDYRCPAIDAMHEKKPLDSGSLKRRLYHLRYNLVFSRRRKAFDRFRAAWSSSPAYTPDTIRTAGSAYDLFVTGSDQVFNLSLTKGDTAYFLDFVAEGKKKVAYAASIGKFLPEEVDRYRRLLSDFSKLSVREQSAAQQMEAVLGHGIPVMPDPVFLHDAEAWRRMLRLDRGKEEQFLLIYALVEDAELYTRGAEISKRLGLKTVVVSKALKPAGKADRVIRDAGPREFAALIDKASFVVTNSFHGTVFSLLFEKEFSVVPPRGAPGRISDLLHMLSLDDRLLKPSASMPQIDYTTVREILSDYRETGTAFLRSLDETLCRS